MQRLRLGHPIRYFSGAAAGIRTDEASLEGRSRHACKAVITLCLFLLAVAQAFADPKLSLELRHAKSGTRVDVIVQFTSDPTERHIGKVTGKGAALKQKLSVVNGAAPLPVTFPIWRSEGSLVNCTITSTRVPDFACPSSSDNLGSANAYATASRNKHKVITALHAGRLPPSPDDSSMRIPADDTPTELIS